MTLFAATNSKNKTNMKKLICFLSLSLVLASCSGDDDSASTQDPTSILVKKMVETTEDGTLTTVYSYDGNKLIEASDSDGYKIVYTYTGDLITKITEYDENDAVSQKNTFTYNAQGQLVEDLMEETIYKWRYNYTHNANGTISVKKYEGALNTNVFTLTSEGTIYDNKVEDTSPYGNSLFTFTYDNKNNPFVNVTGGAKIAFIGDVAATNYRNNVLSETYTSGDSTPSISTITYTYNEANFPVTSVSDEESSEGATTTQYFYE